MLQFSVHLTVFMVYAIVLNIELFQVKSYKLDPRTLIKEIIYMHFVFLRGNVRFQLTLVNGKSLFN